MMKKCFKVDSHWWRNDTEEMVSIYHPEFFDVMTGEMVTFIIDGEEVECKVMGFVRLEKSFEIKGDNIVVLIERVNSDVC